MMPFQLSRSLVLVAVLGYLFTLDLSEARGWEGPEQQQQLQQDGQQLANQVSSIQAQYNNQLRQMDGSNLDRLDSDDDDDDDDRVQLQPASLPQQAGSSFYQRGQQLGALVGDQTAAYPEQGAPVGEDLRTAASKHHGHHKHGAKGWLDMGAWTGKKGAFGWYDKHPVGKGK